MVKKFHFWEDSPALLYRPGTSDEAIIKAVLVDRTEYFFPAFKPKLIFDIGANIGIVSALFAHLYPEAKICAFEPVKENLDLLRQNAAHYPNIVVCGYGLGDDSGKRRIYHSDSPSNLGGFSLAIPHGPGELVPVMDVSEACKQFGTPDLIKIDTEGAEYEILMGMPNLEKVQFIAGELHGVNDYLLLNRLSRYFDLQLGRHFGERNWHFHALSKSWGDVSLDDMSQP